MQRFEGEGLFCEIVLDGNAIRTRTGRVGTDGRLSAPKTFPTRLKAEKELEKLVAQQRAKREQVCSEPLPEPSNPALERLLVEDPHDAGRYLVYADWLQGQAHARGELGVVQSMRVARPDDVALQKAEEKLFKEHPELAPPRFCEAARKPRKAGQSEDGFSSVRWENGFIAVARVARSSDRPPYTVRELVVELLASPAARFLRELRIGPLGPAAGDDFDYTTLIEAIAHARPPTLRILSIVDLPPTAAELGFSDLGDVTTLCTALPLLEDLQLAGRSMKLRAVELVKLRRLHVSSTDPNIVGSLAKVTMPALEELHIGCGEGALEPKTLTKLLAAPWPLRRLAVTRTSNTDAIIAALVGGERLAALDGLDLSEGRLTDNGARLLLANASQFSHLTTLDLSNNSLSPAVVAQVQAKFAGARVTPQRVVASATISDKDLLRLASDPGALAKARALAKPGQWPSLGRDGQTYWGICQGSDRYQVVVSLPDLHTGCTCPSGKRPCKHAIGLAVWIARGHLFEEQAVPRGFPNPDLESNRYQSAWE